MPINFDCVDAVTTKRSSRSGRGLLGFFIHTEMDAIFQPIKKSDTYLIKLLKYKRQMTGNKLCVSLLRFAAQVYTICYPSSDVYTSIN